MVEMISGESQLYESIVALQTYLLATAVWTRLSGQHVEARGHSGGEGPQRPELF